CTCCKFVASVVCVQCNATKWMAMLAFVPDFHQKRKGIGATMNRRQFLGVSAASAFALADMRVQAGEPDVVLYNGIRQPSPWPPGLKLTTEPMAVPYLSSPPAVIPIDVGRQLFVDNFLIEQTNLTRTFHQATYHKQTPVLRPDRKWEQTGQNPMAMV